MYKKIVIAGDQHIPFMCEKAHRVLIKFLILFQPDYYISNGDLLDFWTVSSFDKDPGRQNTLQDDIVMGKNNLQEIRDILPNAEMIFMLGNHDWRFRKNIWRCAPELDTLKILRLENMLELERMKIKFYESPSDVHRINNILFTHGHICSTESAMTARRMLALKGVSIIHNHTHRLGSHYKTFIDGTKGAWENGCMCRPELAKEWRWGYPPDWQNGFSVIFTRGKRFFVSQVFIENGQAMWQGDEISYKDEVIQEEQK